jgi:hypothetical protein
MQCRCIDKRFLCPSLCTAGVVRVLCIAECRAATQCSCCRLLLADVASAVPTSRRTGCMSAALSTSLCMLSRCGASSMPGKLRVLVLQCCKDTPGQYIACMNAIFSAQRLGVVIDGIGLTFETFTTSYIEQVCILEICTAVCLRLCSDAAHVSACCS